MYHDIAFQRSNRDTFSYYSGLKGQSVCQTITICAIPSFIVIVNTPIELETDEKYHELPYS